MALGEAERELLRLLVLCLFRESLEYSLVLGPKGGLLDSRGLLLTIETLAKSSVRLQKTRTCVELATGSRRVKA